MYVAAPRRARVIYAVAYRLSIYVSLSKARVSHCAFFSLAIHELGRCLSYTGRTDEAQDLLRKSLDIKRTVCPDNKAGISGSELLFVLTTYIQGLVCQCKSVFRPLLLSYNFSISWLQISIV